VDARMFAEQFLTQISPLPAGLFNTIHREEILDWLAFLLSRGKAEYLMFK
jgi:hypothetical protein